MQLNENLLVIFTILFSSSKITCIREIKLNDTMEGDKKEFKADEEDGSDQLVWIIWYMEGLEWYAQDRPWVVGLMLVGLDWSAGSG